MGDFSFRDAITGDAITFEAETGNVLLAEQEHSESVDCKSIFFPGCSMINYALPLVSAVYETLHEHQVVDGISVLCCGKILSYEPDGDALRASFEEELRCRLRSLHIKRIVAVCPNCVRALREVLSLDPQTKDIEIVPCVEVFADLGYTVDKETVATMIKGSPDAQVYLCPHDSCPDRDRGEFARGLRRVLTDDLIVEAAHNRSRSLCCGSLPRAAGKFDAADKLARRNGEEALDAKADAIVTSCMSCCFQLNMAQPYIQVVHFLELLYNWRINWATVGAYMKLRFLFEDTLGVTRVESGRKFAGLGAARANDEVKESHNCAAEAVGMSNEDVEIIKE